jgi:small-conductance mechanosensitive channel
MSEFLRSPWVQRLAFALGGLLAGYLVERLVVKRMHNLAVSSRFRWDDLVVESLKGFSIVWLGCGGVYLALTVGALPDVAVSTVQSILMVLLIGSVAVAGMRFAGGTIEVLSTRTQGAIRSPTLSINLARGVVGVLGVFIILQNLGIDITPLITALGIGGLAVALALQDTLSNLFAGVQIILSRQLRPRDDSDLEEVERVTLEVATEVLREIDGGVEGEEPVMLFHTFADSSVNFEVRMLVRDFRSQGPIRHEFIKRLHRRFNADGIDIPFPIRTVVMRREDEA